MDDLIPIGRFASLTRLSIRAIRHYDELGLLHPRLVDASTGYRSCARDQLATARAIAVLRGWTCGVAVPDPA